MKVKGISNTAAYVAIKFYGLTQNPVIGRYFSQDVLNYYSILMDFLPGYLKGYYRWLSHPHIRKALVFFEEMMLPGDLMHIVCRKYLIEELLQHQLPHINQVIIPGSGFDHHAVTLGRQGINVYEIDRPEMIQFKKQFYSANFPDLDQSMLLSADLSIDSLAKVLIHAPEFDAQAPTLVLAEGYWDYLNLKSVKRNLSDLNQSLSTYRLISTFFDLHELNLFHRLSFTSGVTLVGESIKLPLDFESFKALLDEFHHNLVREIPYNKMKEEIVEKKMGLELSVLKGFHIMMTSYSSSS